MTDQWVPAPPSPPPPPSPDGLPPANSWSPVAPCAAADSPSIADGVIITGRPAVVSAMPWQITINDGGSPANFSIDHFDANGVLLEHPIFIEGDSGDVMLTHDPTQPLGAVTKQYADNNPNYVDEAPIDNTTYGRDNGTWVPLPGSYMPEAPNTSQRYGRFNSIWQLDAIQTDAPSDGAAYARFNGDWTPAVTGGPYMPTSGGTFTGVVTFPSNNSVAINGAPSTAHAILGMVAGLARWQLQMPDATTEGVGNSGSNFSLTAFSATGSYLGAWLTIARADGAATFNGAGGVTITAGLAVNGLLAVTNVGNLNIPGGSNGQSLVTNGAGILSWATRLGDAPSDGQFYTRQNAAWAVAPGGMTDAPNDGTAYARNSAAWAHLSHADITDWTANVPAASGSPPIMDSVANAGAATAFSRGDHVHPSDTSRLPIAGGTLTGRLFLNSDPTLVLEAATKRYVDTAAPNANRIINGDMVMTQRGATFAPTGGVYTIDRWAYTQALGTNRGTIDRPSSAAGSTAIAAGISYSLRWTSIASAYALTAGDTFRYEQRIEGVNCMDFAWGTASAQPVTLSFWVNASAAGNYSGAIYGPADTRSYPFTFNIAAANTWERKTVTIPGDTGGTWAPSASAGFVYLRLDLGSGATFRSTAGSWQAGNFSGVTGAQSPAAVANATISFAKVKLELGLYATPWVFQTYAKTLADCQRYYCSLSMQVACYGGAGGAVGMMFPFPAAMRVAPSIIPNFTTNINGTSPAVNPVGTGVYQVSCTATATGNVNIFGTFAADAEI